MSAWPEAIYIIRKLEAALDASFDLENIVTKLETRKTIIANNIGTHDNPIPSGDFGTVSSGAFWVITS